MKSLNHFTINSSNYGAAVVFGVISIVFLIIFLVSAVRLLNKVATIPLLSQKMSELASKVAQLETNQLRDTAKLSQQLVDFQTNAQEAIARNATYDYQGFVQNYIQALLAHVEHALYLNRHRSLRDDSLRTTHAQLHGESLTVILPLGSIHGARQGLVYYLDRIEDSRFFSSPVGLARIGRIEEQRSLAEVQEYESTRDFWETVRFNCRENHIGYPLVLRATPYVDSFFMNCPIEALTEIEHLLRRIERDIMGLVSYEPAAVEDEPESDVQTLRREQ